MELTTVSRPLAEVASSKPNESLLETVLGRHLHSQAAGSAYNLSADTIARLAQAYPGLSKAFEEDPDTI